LLEDIRTVEKNVNLKMDKRCFAVKGEWEVCYRKKIFMYWTFCNRGLKETDSLERKKALKGVCEPFLRDLHLEKH